jgi:ribosomal protein L32E
MRLRVKGRARTVEIGYKQENKNRGKIKNKIPIVVRNLNDIEKVRKENIIIIGKLGKKKKIEILKKIKEKNFEVFNADIEKIINQEIKKEK